MQESGRRPKHVRGARREQSAHLRDLTADARDAASDLRDREAVAEAETLSITDAREPSARELLLDATKARCGISGEKQR